MNLRLRFGFLLILVGLFAGSQISHRALRPQEILDLVNQDRAKHGLADLSLNPTLNLAALAKASDMVEKNYFSHQAPDGREPWYWFKALGYNYAYAGENLAEGYSDPAELENSWMSSPRHRANILSPFYSEVGLGIVNQGNHNVIVQFFGSQDNKVTYKP